MCRITGGSGAIKPVTVIIKDPYQDQCSACNRNRKSKLQPVILHTISGLLPESGSSHSQHKIIQRREYLTLVYKIYRVIRNPGIVEIKDDCEPADNSENNGHNKLRASFSGLLYKGTGRSDKTERSRPSSTAHH